MFPFRVEVRLGIFSATEWDDDRESSRKEMEKRKDSMFGIRSIRFNFILLRDGNES